jgi:hypothetical protein
VEEFYNALLGPAATVGSGLYLRAAIIKWRCHDDLFRVMTMALAGFMLGWMAFWRGMAVLNFMDFDHMREYTLPMGIGIYALHFYVAVTLAHHAQQRARVRFEAAKLQHETRAWAGQGAQLERRQADLPFEGPDRRKPGG